MQIKLVLATALLGATIALAAPAFADMPQPMHQGKIAYVTGGIGHAEQQALKAEARDYNLAVTNADKEGAFTTGTALVIRAKDGRDVLRVDHTGPLFYAKLPAGDYVLHATNSGQNLTRDIRIAPAHAADIHLIWPQQG
jgi:hypothetical protein